MDETLYSAETNEQYLQFAGYEYDKKNIENLSKMNTDQIEQAIDTIEERIKSVIDVKTSSKIYVEVERDSCPVNSKKMQDHKKNE